MKKVLSLVLALSLVLGTIPMAFAASYPDVAGESYSDAVNVLSDLGVVNGYEDGTYKPEKIVTRAEMAVLVVNALGLEDYVTSTAKSSFTDMANYGWAEGYIAYAQSLGVISGYGDGTFKPGNTVSYDEASTMLVAALGYTADSLQGTWPANFVTKAKSLGILDGIKAGSEGANRGDVAVMIYQTLDQAIGKVNKDGDWVGTGIKFDNKGITTEWDTMLSRLGAKKYEAKDAYKRTDVDEDAFIVTGDEDSIINLNPYKGAVVSAYMNDDDDIIAIKEVFSTFASGTFSDTNFNSDTKFKLADGTEYTLKADAMKDLLGTDKDNTMEEFVNGDTKAVGTLAKETQYTLAADISGNKVAEVYSIMKWNVKSSDQVKSDDVADIKSNHKLLGVDFPETDKGEIDMEEFELMGVASLDDIKADSIVYVYENNDEEIARVAVGTQTAQGEVTKVNNDQTKVTLDGKEYKYASQELKNNNIGTDAVSNTKIEAGDEVKLYLDAYGYIYDYDEVSGAADKYAVVLGIEDKDSGKLESDAKIKLFLPDGTATIFNADQDDIKDKNILDANNNWDKTVVKRGSLVKYGLDKDGNISSLKIANAEKKDNQLDFRIVTKGGIDLTSKGYYDGKSIAKDAVLFNYDGSKAFELGTISDDKDDYSVASYDKVLDSSDVEAFYVYDSDDNEIVAMVLNNVTSSNNTYGVVVSQGKNNSDAGAYYNMLIDGKKVSYDGDDAKLLTKDGIKKLHSVKFDASGDIKNFEVWNDTNDKVRNASVSSITASKASLNNKTFAYKDGMKEISYANKAGTTKTVNDITLDSDVVVYVWDAVDAEWQIGSTSDLRNMKDGYSVDFYDVVDEDGIYDIALITEVSSGKTPVNPSHDAKTMDVAVTGGAIVSVNGGNTSIKIDTNAAIENVKLADGTVLAAKTDYTFDGTTFALTVTGLDKVVDAGTVDKAKTNTITIKLDDKDSTTIKVTVNRYTAK